jgi:hypothetical protein
MSIEIIHKIKYIFPIFIFAFFVFGAKAANNVVLWNNGVFENPTGVNNTTVLVTNVVNWLLGITSAIVILFLVVGGIMYVTAAGDEQKTDQAKKIITYCIIGLFIILISYSVVLTLNSIIFG